ncbi:MAG: lipid A biosynthesis acyltransferase [Campylobacterota bacterium]|nr:lipid A biosynthesis acyltransferase [Campylobacterota bacterium]
MAIPKPLIKLCLDYTSEFIYYINREHRNYAKANLDFVFNDELSDDRKKEIIKNSYKNIIYNIYEFIENQTLTQEKLKSKILIENEYVIKEALFNKRKIILVTAHYGNWEYGSSIIPLKYGSTTMVGRPPNNKYLHKEIDKTRTKNNTQMLGKKNATRGLVKALKENRIVGLVTDQNNKNGIEIEFLDHMVKQVDTAARLAFKFDALIIPIFFTRESFGKHILTFDKAIDSRDYTSDNKIEELTQAQALVMTKYIKRYPDQWLWQHRIFKEYSSDIYK